MNSVGCNVYFEYDDIKGNIQIIDYEKKSQTLIIEFNSNINTIKTSHFMRVKFGKILGKITNKFKIEIGTEFKDNKRKLIITDREYRKDKNGREWKWYKYTCNNCGWTEGWIEESNVLKGVGCTCCHGFIVVPGINDIATTDPWMMPYLVDKEDAYKYTHSSRSNVRVKCPKCNTIRKSTLSLYVLHKTKSIGCDCSDGMSYPEKFMMNVLDQLNINYTKQYNHLDNNWCGNYRYDFYLNDNNIIIETHGEQHYAESGFTITLKEQQKRDKQKKELALKNGISEYIVLDCRRSNEEFIKNSIINSKLIKYYDFSNVNWNHANKNALNNLVKEICEYYEINKDKMLIKDIAKTYNVSRDTIRRYLCKGSKFGWCTYI